MWATLNASSRRRVSEPEFVAELSGAAQTATASSLSAGRLLSIQGQEARVSFVVRTHIFGRLHEVLQIPLSGSGGGTQVVFNTSLLFPGLRSGELLSRRTLIGRRGTLLADNGQPLAEGTSLRDTDPDHRERDRRHARPNSGGTGDDVRAGGLPARCEGRAGRARGDLPAPAGGQVGGKNCWPARACWPRPSRVAEPRSIRRSTRHSSRTRSTRSAAITAASR